MALRFDKISVKLNNIVNYLNKRFNQDSDEYSIFQGAKPQVIRYDEETAISTWACGAIVCIGDMIYFLSEDDGTWRFHGNDCGIATQSNFSIGWAKSFAEAMESLTKYVEENGEPVRYRLGIDSEGNIIEGDICHYQLK